MTAQPEALPLPEQTALEVGYIRLTDSAPLIMAASLGLYEKYGLDVTLRREVSWANLRDKVVVGALDAAQMLAPLPLTTALGLGGLRANMVTGLVLSLNGNAITLARGIAEEVFEGSVLDDAAASAQRFGDWLRQSEPSRSITLASAHGFSCHSIQLRLWLRAGGLDPDRDLRIIVLPPEQMMDSLARGVIDGYCVGEPWNSVAVQHGIGEVVATGYGVWNNLAEKVLGVTEQWHQQHPATHLRLRMALMEACQWLADEANCEHAVKVLSETLALPERQLAPSLTGRMQFRREGQIQPQPYFHVFGRFQAGFPWRSTANDILEHCAGILGRPLAEEDRAAVVQQTYRTDLYRDAARRLGMVLPAVDNKPTNEHREVWQLAPGLEMGPDVRLGPHDSDPR
ncbi:MAG: CmpA/NrtA family ABC transporter substrate-binding protein [Pseudomonadota bacterium]